MKKIDSPPSLCRTRIVVLIGGNGSNLQALIDAQAHGVPIEIVGVISHNPEAYGLKRAEKAAIPTCVIHHRDYPAKTAFEAALILAIENFQPQLIVMAGFMRILSSTFVNRFPRQILNIHPSLLPKYKGLHTHQRVLEAKDNEHGVSIHLVTEELDAGPIIAQVKIPVLPNEDLAQLTQRIHQAEHWLYPQVLSWFAQNRLIWNEHEVVLDNKRLGPQGLQLSLSTEQGIFS